MIKNKIIEFKRENTDDVNYRKSSKSLNNLEALAADTRENMIISLFEEKDLIVRKDVETALGVSQATSVLILREMVNKGALRKEDRIKRYKALSCLPFYLSGSMKEPDKDSSISFLFKTLFFRKLPLIDTIRTIPQCRPLVNILCQGNMRFSIPLEAPFPVSVLRVLQLSLIHI